MARFNLRGPDGRFISRQNLDAAQLGNVRLDTRQLLRSASRQLENDMSKKLNTYAKELNRNVTRGEGLDKLNEKYAAEVRRRAKVAFVGSRARMSGPYRNSDSGRMVNGHPRWKRYSGGKLAEVVGSEKATYADRSGITFFDRKVMDKKAPQWYRLNFGTVGGSSRQPATSNMSFFKEDTGMKVSYEGFGQSKDFKIPKGFWSSTRKSKTRGTKLAKPVGSNDAFYPTKLNPKPSKGMQQFGGRRKSSINGTNFLDESLKYFNTYYPRSLESLALRWAKSKRLK